MNFFLYFLKVKLSHSVMSNSLWPHRLYSPWNFPGQNLPVNWEKWKVKVLAAQLCPTLCDPINCSLPGFSAHGILQIRVLVWVAIPFSRGSPQGLLNCRWILYHLSHQEALYISYQSGKIKIMYGKELEREKLKKIYKELLFKAKTPDFLRVVTKEPLYYSLRSFGHSPNTHFHMRP